MIKSFKRILPVLLIVASLPGFAQKRKPATAPAAPTAPSQPIKLFVDATHAPEKILHAQVQIPVQPGEVTVQFPGWLVIGDGAASTFARRPCPTHGAVHQC